MSEFGISRDRDRWLMECASSPHVGKLAGRGVGNKLHFYVFSRVQIAAHTAPRDATLLYARGDDSGPRDAPFANAYHCRITKIHPGWGISMRRIIVLGMAASLVACTAIRVKSVDSSRHSMKLVCIQENPK